MKDFKNLKVWKKAHNLTLEMYDLVKKVPKEELYGLISQIRRAGYSIPTNIAEGCGRRGDKEFARFLNISMGSACELEYLILLTYDLNYISRLDFNSVTSLIIEVKQMLSSLIKKLRAES
jgi:four helix bundle protein